MDRPKSDQPESRDAGDEARDKLLREMHYWADPDRPATPQDRELRSQLIAYMERLSSDDERLVRLSLLDRLFLSDFEGEALDLFMWPTSSGNPGSASDLLDQIVEAAERVGETYSDQPGSRAAGDEARDNLLPPDLDGWQVINAEDALAEDRAVLRERTTQLIYAGKRHVVLDLSLWMSPDRFPPIGNLAEAVELAGGSLVVIASEPAVKVFEVTGLDERWPIFASKLTTGEASELIERLRAARPAAARAQRHREEVGPAPSSSQTPADQVPPQREGEPPDEVPPWGEREPADFPAHAEVTRRGWQVVWGHGVEWGEDFYWLEVLDSQGRQLARSRQVERGNGVWVPAGGEVRWTRSLTGDPAPYDPSRAEPVDMDAQAELICAEAIRREQARVDRWRSRSRLSRAWATITGKDE